MRYLLFFILTISILTGCSVFKASYLQPGQSSDPDKMLDHLDTRIHQRYLVCRVEKVIDGDTITIRIPNGPTQLPGLIREYVRLIGVNAPEFLDNQRRKDYRYTRQGWRHADPRWQRAHAVRAKHELQSILPGGTPIVIEFDTHPWDCNGRLLGYVWKHKPGELLVNEELLRRGSAKPFWLRPNVRYYEQIMRSYVPNKEFR